MTDEEKYENYKKLCKEHNFKPPIRLEKFNTMDFRYVIKIKPNELQCGSQFLSNEELSAIPRKIDKPFCHPGPERICELYHWYLADSIVQEVNLKCDNYPHFVVRWVGYEDKCVFVFFVVIIIVLMIEFAVTIQLNHWLLSNIQNFQKSGYSHWLSVKQQLPPSKKKCTLVGTGAK